MMTPLGDITTISTGFPFRKKVQPEPGGDLVLVQIKDIDGAEGASATGTVMLRSDRRKYDRYLLQEGDLLFQSRGSRHPVAIVGEGLRGIAASGLHVVRPDTNKVNPEYLAWWLSHPSTLERLSREFARGTHIPFVSKADLTRFPVPVPDLDTQHKIVNVWRLRREAQVLNERLNELVNQLTDAITLTAATREN